MLDADKSKPPADDNAPTLELSDAEVDALISGLAPRVRKENERVNNELTRLAERAQIAANASGAAIALRSGEALVCRGRAGTTAPAHGARLDLASGLSGECARSGGIMLCDDTETDKRVDVNSCRALGIRSILVVPLYDQGEVIGIFEVFSPEQQAFGHEDIAVLQTMAEMVVSTLHSSAMQATTKEGRSAGEAKPEIIAATPLRPVAESDRLQDASIDLSKLIIEDEAQAGAEQPPTLIQFPPAAKKGDRAEEFAPFHDPGDDLICELGPERIADLLEQPEMEEPGKPALKLFRAASEEEPKAPAISRKLIIVAGAVLLVALVWLKFCNREQAPAPEGQSSEAPMIEPAIPAAPADVPAAQRTRTEAPKAKPKVQNPVKKHEARPAQEPTGAVQQLPAHRSDAGRPEASEMGEEVRLPPLEAPEVLSAPLVIPDNPGPSPPDRTKGQVHEATAAGSSRSFRLAQADSGIVSDVSRRRSKAEELANLEYAAARGDAQAELSLAVSYAYADGVTQDYFEAVKWFTLAAAQGVTPARGRVLDAWKRTHRWLSGHEKELAQNH